MIQLNLIVVARVRNHPFHWPIGWLSLTVGIVLDIEFSVDEFFRSQKLDLQLVLIVEPW